MKSPKSPSRLSHPAPPPQIHATDEQLGILRAAFRESKTASAVQVTVLSDETGLPFRWIQLWYQRERRRLTKASRTVIENPASTFVEVYPSPLSPINDQEPTSSSSLNKDMTDDNEGRYVSRALVISQQKSNVVQYGDMSLPSFSQLLASTTNISDQLTRNGPEQSIEDNTYSTPATPLNGDSEEESDGSAIRHSGCLGEDNEGIPAHASMPPIAPGLWTLGAAAILPNLRRFDFDNNGNLQEQHLAYQPSEGTNQPTISSNSIPGNEALDDAATANNSPATPRALLEMGGNLGSSRDAGDLEFFKWFENILQPSLDGLFDGYMV
ncbi:hypothetical protein NLJ89_g10291 [Agrocybe chaxingu]|uniref:Homeobox domain-containing protein n=1 Tax=Agrocybe chaxingu TaxID=84603 RepID=A0A9W8JQV7_9AGAR|nr:hypothetical protein NLJ89_g10291 [Agrocybe chaxingu]